MRKEVKLLDSGCSSMGGPEGGQSAQAAEQDAGAAAQGRVGLAGMSGSGSPPNRRMASKSDRWQLALPPALPHQPQSLQMLGAASGVWWRATAAAARAPQAAMHCR